MSHAHKVLKVVILGESGFVDWCHDSSNPSLRVGKTALLERYPYDLNLVLLCTPQQFP